MDNLTKEEKIGQHFIIGTNSHDTDFIVDLIKNYYIGGVILYKKNYHSYNEMIDVITKFKEANKDNKIPLFIAIDQEFGKVNRLSNDFHNMRNIYDVSKFGKRYVENHAKIITFILSSVGINMNLAPVLDIYDVNKPKQFYKRCFAGGISEISKYGKAYIDIHKKSNILAVCKHFPGHGSTKYDSHRIVPYIKDDKNILKEHIKPFENLYNDMDAMMIGHLKIANMSDSYPASISNEFLEKYVKKEYNGLIISDEITMLKRNIFWPIYKKMSIISKDDILIIKSNFKNEVIKYIKKYAKKVDEKILNDMAKRVIDIKNKYHINDSTNFKKFDLKRINMIIDEFNDKIPFND